MDVAAQARALDELRTKTLCEIHAETAVKWAWRARAAYYIGHADDAEWRYDFIEYRHEAIEHAALVGDDLSVLALVRRITEGLESDEKAFRTAIDELRSKSLVEIQKETAFLWAYRAWGAYRLKLTADAIDYESEALEHAALSGDDSVFFAVREIIKEL